MIPLQNQDIIIYPKKLLYQDLNFTSPFHCISLGETSHRRFDLKYHTLKLQFYGTKTFLSLEKTTKQHIK